MTWTATIQSIADTPVPSMNKDMRVLFSDGAQRQITRPYQVSADIALNAQAVAQYLQAECAKLDAGDQVVADLTPLLGQVISAASVPQPLKVMSVTPYQANMVLLNTPNPNGGTMLDVVNTLLALPENKAAYLAWEYGKAVERDSQFIATLGPTLGFTDEQIDALFLAASQIT